MLIENKQETQKSLKQYLITLLSGEIIDLNCIIEEDIREERDGYIDISLNSATYNQRLYDAFKNKELVQCIRKNATNVDINDSIRQNIDRNFTYESYFKINEFCQSYGTNRCSTYSIEFQSV